MTDKVAIRFLRQGYLAVDKPENFDNWNQKEQLEWADTVLGNQDDKILLEAMSDFVPDAIPDNGYFDEAPMTTAIEDNTTGTTILTTKEWNAFVNARTLIIKDYYDETAECYKDNNGNFAGEKI